MLPAARKGSENAMIPNIPARNGRRIVARISTIVMTSIPAASAELARPQPSAPSEDDFAYAGPSTCRPPDWIALRIMKATTTTHSQVVLRKYVHPARRSWIAEVFSASAGRGGIRTGSRKSAASSQVSASTANAQPAPTPTTRAAATDGPRIVRVPRDIESSRLAGCRSFFATSCGTIPCIAGKAIAIVVPLSASRTTRCQISACPVMTSAAAAAWVTAEATLLSCSTSRRGNRSAITPPTSRNTTIGMVCAATT